MGGGRILVVEDEALIAEEIRERVAAAGYTVVAVVDTGAAALQTVAVSRPDLVLMDIRLKGPMDGIEAAELIYDRFGVPIIYLTAHSDQGTLQRARARAAFGYVLKPFHVDSLLVAIDVGMHRAQIEARLHEHELTFAAILGSLSEGVLTTDAAGRVRLMNAVAEQLLGWTTRGAEGRPLATVLKLTDEAGLPVQERLVKRIVAAHQPLQFGVADHLVRANGERIPISGGAAPVIDYLGRVVGVTVTVRDASAARRAERELRSLSAELQAVVDTAVDGVMLVDADGAIRVFNPACARLSGYAAEELVGRNVAQLMPSPLAIAERGTAPGDGDGDGGGAAAPLLAAGRATMLRRKDGTSLPVEVSVGEADHLGKPVFALIVHDVSERRDLQEAYFDAAGTEQRRMARDLHDGLGQELTGLALLLSALERGATEAGLPNAGDLARVRDLASHTIGTCRSVARGLLPVADAQGGLVAGLHDLVRRLNDVPGPAIQFSVIEAATVGLSASTTDHLYRIAQEALTNALKHARANSIQVTLDVGRSAVLLRVCDDGTGIAAGSPDPAGLGLKTMRYRAELIGARLRIEGLGRAGTCVVCECPQQG